jgi:hypothetical protein
MIFLNALPRHSIRSRFSSLIADAEKVLPRLELEELITVVTASQLSNIGIVNANGKSGRTRSPAPTDIGSRVIRAGVSAKVSMFTRPTCVRRSVATCWVPARRGAVPLAG